MLLCRQAVENGYCQRDGRSTSQARRPRLFTDADLKLLTTTLAEDPVMYLDEIQWTMYRLTGKFASTSVMYRELLRANITHKKVMRLHAGRNTLDRAKFMRLVSEHDFRDFVWFDETGSQQRHQQRMFGWGRRGERARAHLPRFSGKRYSLAASMSHQGPGPTTLVQGSVNRERFLRYMHTTLLPWMNPHYNQDGSLTGNPLSVLILDNCSTHR